MTAVRGRRQAYARFVGSLWVAVSVFYALFALTVAFEAIAAFAGLSDRDPGRAAPPLFIVHAVTGSIALTAIALQFRLTAPPGPSRRRLHRRLGTTYVITAITTSILSIGVIAGFRVDGRTKVLFLSEALLWLVTTVAAYRHIRRGRITKHRRWMIRSSALAVFFVSFSVWDPVMAATPLPAPTGYALAVLLAWSVNLLAAEIWIRARPAKHAR
ncbi:DUF2306 domain-containing protein [Streptomyces sp. NPDC002659]|uniref:DUF2306 domain-containing protein n=1 Tax=Streptomyces sp. NPDC002659 TaxID=3364656 RepID=UPI0036853EEE